MNFTRSSISTLNLLSWQPSTQTEHLEPFSPEIRIDEGCVIMCLKDWHLYRVTGNRDRFWYDNDWRGVAPPGSPWEHT